MPPMTKDRGKCELLSPMKKFSITHHAEGNSMASPAQIVVGKGISNPLTTEDLCSEWEFCSYSEREGLE